MSEIFWLNKETLEERWLHPYFCFITHDLWVKVPEGATFATGDKDNFVFRKDWWYYEDGVWVATELTFDKVGNYSQLKLFWVKSDVKDNIFTLKRLLGCEVSLYGKIGYICNTYNGHGGVCFLLIDGCVISSKPSYLTFFTEDGDELTFDDYVQLYYPFG